MWQAIFEFLKKMGGKAATAVKGMAKEAVTHPYKTALKATPAGQALSLYDAFKGIGGGGAKTATVGGMGEVPIAPADYYKSSQAQMPSSAGSVGGGGGMGGAGQGIFGSIGESGVGGNQGQDIQTYEPNRTAIPSQYQQFVRKPTMQYVPGPQGGVIGGEGDVMSGYEMQPPPSTVPAKYLSMMNQQGGVAPADYYQRNTQGLEDVIPTAPRNYYKSPEAQVPYQGDVGAMRGFINEVTGQPQPENLMTAPQGRRTAYYAGGLIPKIIMSKLGQPSSAEETQRQSMISQRKNTATGQNPVFGIDENGQLTQMGSVAKGSRIVTPSQMETPTQKAEREITTTTQKEKAKSFEATQKAAKEFQGFIRQFDRSYEELNKFNPNIGDVGVGGTAMRLAGKGAEKLGYLPETSAFLKQLAPRANLMARTIEGGRITDEDRDIYAKGFANALSAPSATNIRLMSETLIDAYQKGGNINQVLSMLNSSQSDVLKMVVKQVNEQIGQEAGGQETSQFNFSNMSTEELLKRKQELLQGGR